MSVDKIKDKVKVYIFPKLNEDYISVTYGCISVFDSYHFLSSSFDSLYKMLDIDFKTLKERISR